MRGHINAARDYPILRAAAAKGATLRQLAETWMADFVTPKLKPRTAFDYEQIHLARPGEGAASARTARSGLRLVHRGVRHARSEGGEGVVGGVGGVSCLLVLGPSVRMTCMVCNCASLRIHLKPARGTLECRPERTHLVQRSLRSSVPGASGR